MPNPMLEGHSPSPVEGKRMKLGVFDFIRLGVSGEWNSYTVCVGSFEEAFRRLGMQSNRWVRIVDGGDKVIIEDCDWRGVSSRRKGVVFHIDGLLHLPAAVVLAVFREISAHRDRKVMAWEVDGFRIRPVHVKKWSLRGEFGSAQIGCERRANAGMAYDEEMQDHGLRARPCRRLLKEYRFERGSPKDISWKRFRRTRWKDVCF
jgi:hypothetical protein